MRFLELRVPPVLVVIAFALFMAGAARLVPFAQVHIPARSTIALAFAAAGAWVASAGVVAFRRMKTTVNPMKPDQASALVARGIYRFSRNPMYVGLLLVLTAWAVHLANGAAMLLLPVFIAYMNAFQIRPEERALTEKFGPQFIDYTKAVRRWL